MPAFYHAVYAAVMAKLHRALDERLRGFIAQQHIFFNASAPNEGRINVSPKGQDTFRVLDDQTVAYLDLTGSENETAAHLAQNGRLTLMFCSFAEKPSIVRLYGKGRVVRRQDAEFASLHQHFQALPGERQIIVLSISSVMETCGFAVPRYQWQGDRAQLAEFTCKMGDEKMEQYRHERNETSIDGFATHLFDGATPASTRRFLLRYEKVPDHATRCLPLQGAHRDYLAEAVAKGRLLYGGNIAGKDESVILMRADSSAEVEAFAAADPYVQEGIVARFRVDEWQLVVGSLI
jgi:uncharacterized protein YciI